MPIRAAGQSKCPQAMAGWTLAGKEWTLCFQAAKLRRQFLQDVWQDGTQWWRAKQFAGSTRGRSFAAWKLRFKHVRSKGFLTSSLHNHFKLLHLFIHSPCPSPYHRAQSGLMEQRRGVASKLLGHLWRGVGDAISPYHVQLIPGCQQRQG